jgi:hypothetical protein
MWFAMWSDPRLRGNRLFTDERGVSGLTGLAGGGF